MQNLCCCPLNSWANWLYSKQIYQVFTGMPIFYLGSLRLYYHWSWEIQSKGRQSGPFIPISCSISCSIFQIHAPTFCCQLSQLSVKLQCCSFCCQSLCISDATAIAIICLILAFGQKKSDVSTDSMMAVNCWDGRIHGQIDGCICFHSSIIQTWTFVFHLSFQ